MEKMFEKLDQIRSKVKGEINVDGLTVVCMMQRTFFLKLSFDLNFKWLIYIREQASTNGCLWRVSYRGVLFNAIMCENVFC